jgi:serine/threonine-protein phosphatase PGAM5
MSAVRVLYLVRHGHYDSRDPRDQTEGKALLPEGIRQAELTGERFARLGAPINHVYCSDFTRARQTAEIIAARLPGVPLHVDPDLREIVTFHYRKGTPSVLEELGGPDRESHPATAIAAFAKYFARLPDGSHREVLVCHGNLIRYFLSRLWALTPAQWDDLFIHNCSITEIHIDSGGVSEVVSVCNEDHIPKELQL